MVLENDLGGREEDFFGEVNEALARALAAMSHLEAAIRRPPEEKPIKPKDNPLFPSKSPVVSAALPVIHKNPGEEAAKVRAEMGKINRHPSYPRPHRLQLKP